MARLPGTPRRPGFLFWPAAVAQSRIPAFRGEKYKGFRLLIVEGLG